MPRAATGPVELLKQRSCKSVKCRAVVGMKQRAMVPRLEMQRGKANRIKTVIRPLPKPGANGASSTSSNTTSLSQTIQ